VELVSDFKEFLTLIEPSDRAVTKAKAAHEKVRDQLRTDDDSKDAHKETFFSGSYARHTAINDINDVDIICVFDIDRTITSPEMVLAWLMSILAKYYDKIEVQGRSVGVEADNGVWLDIVPATLMYGDGGPLWIPDREARQWVQTHPKGQIAAATSKNQATNGYYVQTVKLLKSWRDRLPTESSKPKSYILETLVHQTIGYPTSHAKAVVSVLEGIERTYGGYRNTGMVPSIADPGYPPVNVAKRWESKEFDGFMTQVKSAAVTARQALDSTDEATSRKLWRQLFGPRFGQ
jgi:hypothetical protein